MRFILLSLLLPAAMLAGQKGIRLSGSAQPGASSLDSIVESVTRGASSDRQRALALHRFGMEHFIHFIGPVEQEGVPVTDPLKLISVYGYALCGNNSSAMAALYNLAGMKARVRRFQYHEVPEVWFEGKWNYIDTDMFGYVFLPDGETIASIDEIIARPDLFLTQKNPPTPFFPFDDKADMADVFRHKENQKDYHPYANAHMMELDLRTGEAVTMYFKPQGRFFLGRALPRNLGTEYLDYWTLGPVRKGSLAWRDSGPAAYGNARFDYEPDLRAAAFLKEAQSATGIRAGTDAKKPALMAASQGSEAVLIIDVTTPWIIAGLQNDLSGPDDDRDGAVVSGYFWRGSEQDTNRISVSTDHGRTWQDVWTNKLLGAVPFQVDLTRWIAGEPGYQVRFTWTDRSGGAGLSQLRVKTWVELSPMALPRLIPGDNAMSLSVSPHSVHYERSLWDRGRKLPNETPVNLNAAGASPYRTLKDPSKPGELMFDLGVRARVEEARVSILARREGKSPKVSVSTSTDEGRSWTLRQDFRPHPEHQMPTMWFNQTLRAAAKVKITVQDAALEQVIANSLVNHPPAHPGALRVTHAWKEGDRERSFSSVFDVSGMPARYTVNAGQGLVNEWIRIEAPSR